MNLKKIIVALGSAAFLSASLLTPRAQALTYTNANLECMLCFRQLGAANPFDLEVNLGCVTNLTALSVGSSITINNYTVAQLSNAMGTSNFANVEFSVNIGSQDGSFGPSTNFPLDIAWVTRSSSGTNTQSAPYARSSQGTLGSACGDMNTLGAQAAFYSGINTADPLANTATAVAIAPGNSSSCEKYIGPGSASKLNGTFPQAIGHFAPSPFTAAIRSDFYVDYPIGNPDPNNTNATSGNVSLVGYFIFYPDGTTTFTRASTTQQHQPPPAPVLSISQTNGMATISFNTTNGATYTLIATNINGLSVARSNWLTVGASIVGTGARTNLTDVTTDSNRVYSVTAH